MSERDLFIDWLLPDAHAALQANPGRFRALEPDVQALLQDVSCQTGVPVAWLADAAGLVVDGLGGLQCLWFLHGASGELEAAPDHLPPEHRSEIERLSWKAQKSASKKARKRNVFAYVRYWVDWWHGTVKEERGEGSKPPERSRTLKLGKWLRKHGASPELMRAFETRELPLWEWRISANPLDVLTMSFRRPWTSCMRPPEAGEEAATGGASQYGPLTDMAAGAAILFWHRPGASAPCGRMLLRPALSPSHYEDAHHPMVLWPGRTYGCGPDLSVVEFEDMLRPVLDPLGIPVSGEGACEAGDDARALSRFVYSDVNHAFCKQNDLTYQTAYANLGTMASWPEPRFKGHQMRSTAIRWKGQLDNVLEGMAQYDVPKLITLTTNNLIATQSTSWLMKLIGDRELGELGLLVYEALEHIDLAAAEDDDIWNDVKAGVYDELADLLTDQARQYPTDLFAFPTETLSWSDDLANAVAEVEQDYYGELLDHQAFARLAHKTAMREAGFDPRRRAAQLSEEEAKRLRDWERPPQGVLRLGELWLMQDADGIWRTPEGDSVAVLLAVSHMTDPSYTQSMLDQAVASAELPPGGWDWWWE